MTDRTRIYRHQHCTVIHPTQLCNTVQEDSGHLLVFVFHKPENFEGEAAHLAFPILKNRGLWVFVTTIRKMKLRIRLSLSARTHKRTRTRKHTCTEIRYSVKGHCKRFV